jgi:hypothetical protein
MIARLRVQTTEATWEVETSLWVVIQWERKFKRKASDMANSIGAEDLVYLAWEASKLQGVVVQAAFDDFAKRCVDVKIVEEEQENPTQPEPIENS